MKHSSVLYPVTLPGMLQRPVSRAEVTPPPQMSERPRLVSHDAISKQHAWHDWKMSNAWEQNKWPVGQCGAAGEASQDLGAEAGCGIPPSGREKWMGHKGKEGSIGELWWMHIDIWIWIHSLFILFSCKRRVCPKINEYCYKFFLTHILYHGQRENGSITLSTDFQSFKTVLSEQ